MEVGILTKLKTLILAIAGTVGGLILQLFGGADAMLVTLLILIITDYITGITVAAVFKKSTKTDTGGLSSKEGLKGIIKKVMMLVIVMIAVRIDIVLGTDYIRNAVVTAFIANEIISLTENAGLMGVPIPKIISNAIDILKRNADNESNDTSDNKK